MTSCDSLGSMQQVMTLLGHEVGQPGPLVAQQLLAGIIGGRSGRVLNKRHRKLCDLGTTMLAYGLPQGTCSPVHILVCMPQCMLSKVRPSAADAFTAGYTWWAVLAPPYFPCGAECTAISPSTPQGILPRVCQYDKK